MGTINYASIYVRVALQGSAIEALFIPRTFAQWGEQEVLKTPAMREWKARQWFGAFLQAITGVPWIVSATSLDLADWPRHDATKLLVKKERTSDDPPVPLQPWMRDMALSNAEGAVVLQYINEVLASSTSHASFYDLVDSNSHLKKPGNQGG